MLHDTIFFNSNEFADYGPLKDSIATELNTLLREAIVEDNIELDDCDALPNNLKCLINDMRNCPDLYVSAPLSIKIRHEASQQNPD